MNTTKVKNYVTIIEIEKVSGYQGKMIFVEGKGGIKYSHFIDKKWDGWEKNLIVGKIISVFVRDTGKYKNIYPDITQLNPITNEELI